MNSRLTILLAAVTVWLAQSPVIADSRILLSLPAGKGEVLETAWSLSPPRIALAVREGDVTRILVDGVEVGRHERAERLSISAQGDWVYWAQDKGRQRIHTPRGAIGPYDEISCPNLELVGQANTREAGRLAFRGGNQVAFAARDREGGWKLLLRYPGEPTAQESRPLPTTMAVSSGPSPTPQVQRAIRYWLLRDKVPFFVGRNGDTECLVVDGDEVGCGDQASLLAWNPDSGRTALGLTKGASLVLATGLAWMGPYENVDWVSFSPSGAHLAYVTRTSEGNALVLDGTVIAQRPRVDALMWLNDNELAWLIHDRGRSEVWTTKGKMLESLGITGMYRSPKGELVWDAYDSRGRILKSDAGDLRARDIWNQGFLSDGRRYLAARTADGKQVFVLGQWVSRAFNGLERMNSSPDESTLLTVGSDGEEKTLFLGNEEWFKSRGSVESIEWCDGRIPAVRMREGENDCLYVPGSETAECCSRIVLTVCGERPAPVCLVEGKVLFPGHSGFEAWDQLPLMLADRQVGGGCDSFVAQRGEQWFLVTEESEVALPIQPSMIYPTDFGGWLRLLLAGPPAQQQWWSRRGAQPTFGSVGEPFSWGDHVLYRAREARGEAWVVDGTPGSWWNQLLSPPMFGEGIFLYWVREEQGAQSLVLAPLDSPAGKPETPHQEQK